MKVTSQTRSLTSIIQVRRTSLLRRLERLIQAGLNSPLNPLSPARPDAEGSWLRGRATGGTCSCGAGRHNAQSQRSREGAPAPDVPPARWSFLNRFVLRGHADIMAKQSARRRKQPPAGYSADFHGSHVNLVSQGSAPSRITAQAKGRRRQHRPARDRSVLPQRSPGTKVLDDPSSVVCSGRVESLREEPT